MSRGMTYRVISSSKSLNEPAESEHSLTEQERWLPIKGVIFDMDGTLTVPVLDFVAMHNRLNIPMTSDILLTVQAMAPEQREEAERIIVEMETEANERLKMQPGLLEVLNFLAEKDITRGILTRNTPQSVDVFLGRLREQVHKEQETFPKLDPNSLFSKVQ